MSTETLNLWGLLGREGAQQGSGRGSSHCFPQLNSAFPLSGLGYNLHSTKNYQGNLETQAAKPVGWHQLLSPRGLSYPFFGGHWGVMTCDLCSQQGWESRRFGVI